MTVAMVRLVRIPALAGMIMEGVVEAATMVVLMMTNEDIEGVIGEAQVVFVVEAGDTKMIAIISETEIVVIEVHRHDQGEADPGVPREDMVEVEDVT